MNVKIKKNNILPIMILIGVLVTSWSMMYFKILPVIGLLLFIGVPPVIGYKWINDATIIFRGNNIILSSWFGYKKLEIDAQKIYKIKVLYQVYVSAGKGNPKIPQLFFQTRNRKYPVFKTIADNEELETLMATHSIEEIKELVGQWAKYNQVIFEFEDRGCI